MPMDFTIDYQLVKQQLYVVYCTHVHNNCPLLIQYPMAHVYSARMIPISSDKDCADKQPMIDLIHSH
jgi:hypothetical protein